MRWSALVLLTLVAALCSGMSAFAQGGLEYRLGIGDKVKVVVFGQPDLTGEAEIDASGKIVVGLIGEVAAASRTLADVQGEIRARLDKDYLVDPKVSVQIVAYRPITMLGQVKSPGRYPYSAGLTVRQAVALAGGYDKRASTSSALVFREGRELEIEIDAPVRPGDTIEIQRRFF
jgi:protein involved in polysaccharide export with SLBB domain